MITLYVKSSCQYSAHAIAALDIYNVPFTEKNIADPDNEAELIEIGGKRKVPFLVDGDIHLYDSEAIAQYVQEKYGEGIEKEITLHKSDADTCST